MRNVSKLGPQEAVATSPDLDDELVELREEVEEAGQELAALREALGFQVPLACTEARAEWADVTPHMDALQERLLAVLGRGGDEARLKLHVGRIELCQAWYGVAPSVHLVVGRVRGQSERPLRELLRRVRERFAGWLAALEQRGMGVARSSPTEGAGQGSNRP